MHAIRGLYPRSTQVSLPEWLELATARLAARHRTELSRLRGVLGGQLASLRRDLRDMKAACAASLADAGQQAEETLQQVRPPELPG